jgi:hypothetical protein
MGVKNEGRILSSFTLLKNISSEVRSQHFFKYMNEDKMLDKKKTTGKRSVYRLVDAQSFVDVVFNDIWWDSALI